MRKLIGLMALLGALGVLVVSAPAAGANLVGESIESGEFVGEPNGGEMSPQSESQCPQGYMCIWEGPVFYNGNFAAWPGSSTGCHNHINVPEPNSAWNRTGYTVQIGGRGTMPSGGRWVCNCPIYGLICW